MEAIAEQTGGKAFYNTNDLAAAAEEVIDLGSNFYTVTYTPTQPEPRHPLPKHQRQGQPAKPPPQLPQRLLRARPRNKP